MARRARMQMAMTKGVLDPGLGERIDLVHYYQAVKRGDNVEFLAQGGFTRRAGRRLASEQRLRRRLVPVPIAASMVTAHNGGTAANLVDQDDTTLFTTASPAGGSLFIVVEIDLGVARTVSFLDLVDLKCQTGSLADALGVEYWTGSVWATFGGPESLAYSARTPITTEARRKRFGVAPGEIIVTRYLRVAVYDAVGIGTISVGGVSVWTEAATGEPSSVRLISFAKSVAEINQLVLTDYNIDVYDDGVYLASIRVPVPGELVDEINVEQSQDTVLLFHEDVQTRRIIREGVGDEWAVAAVTYQNAPVLTQSMALSAARDELQELTVPFTAGDSLMLLLGEQQTAPFTATTAAALPAQIQAALSALPGVAAGIVATLISAGDGRVAVAFAGAAGARAWPRIVVRNLSSGAGAIASVLRRGVPAIGAGVLVFSATTGWPRAGAVWQGRLIVGGMRAAPQTLVFSRAGNVYDFQTTGAPVTADLGIVLTLDTDAVETIEDIFIGRHLQVFTEAGNWWSDNRTIDATQPVNFILSSRYGVERAVPLVFAENATLFLESGGRTVRDFLYSDTSQSYEAEALSLLAPQLVTQARSIGYRRAATTAECNHLTVVNEDGTVALLSLLRRQEVIAWARHTTPAGLVRETMTDLLDRVWYVVRRGTDLWFEKRDTSLLTDCTVERDIGALGLVTGLPACLEGQLVWALVDGDLDGPHTVVGGQIMLAATDGTALIGLDFGTDVEGLDLREQLQNAQPFRPPVRIYEAELALANTGYIEFGANGAEPEEVPLRHVDGETRAETETGEEPDNDFLDVPMMQRLYTGRVTIEQLEGWTETGRWRLRQRKPAPMTVRSARLEVATRG